jgi:murein DD-endopeptidase MepM/ murein hydrolase activator NlpD
MKGSTLNVRNFISVKTNADDPFRPYVKAINRIGHVTEGVGKNLREIGILIEFQNNWLDSYTKRTTTKLEKKDKNKQNQESLAEKVKKKLENFLRDRRSEEKTEKLGDRSVEEGTKEALKKEGKKLGFLEQLLTSIGKFLEPIVKGFLLYNALNWIAKADSGQLNGAVKTLYSLAKFAYKVTSFGIGKVMDGVANTVGSFKENALARTFRFLIGAVEILVGVAALKGAQYLLMPWKILTDANFILKTFSDFGKLKKETEAQIELRKTGYRDKDTGRIYSKEEYDAIKKSAQRADKKRAKRAGKGFESSLYQDAIDARFQGQYHSRKKGRLSKLRQRGRIAKVKAGRGLSKLGQSGIDFLGTPKAMKFAKIGGGVMSVFGGVNRAVTGLAEGERASSAVGAGIGSAAGGIAGAVAGGALLPFLGPLGPIVGSAIGSFLGEFIGKEFVPLMEPIFAPIGRYFSMIGKFLQMSVGGIAEEYGQYFNRLMSAFGRIAEVLSASGSKIMNLYKWFYGGLWKKAVGGFQWMMKQLGRLKDPKSVALGYLDTLTFGLTDFDGMGKAAGGAVEMAKGGAFAESYSPEELTLINIGQGILSSVTGAFRSFGYVGQLVASNLTSDVGRLSNTFGGRTIATKVSGGLPSSARSGTIDLSMSSDAGDDRLVSIVSGDIKNTLMRIIEDLPSYKGGAGSGAGAAPTQPTADPTLTPAEIQAIKASSADKRAAAHLATLEATAPQHVADVYQVILNRAAKQSGGIAAVITAREQFTPYSAALYGSSEDENAQGKYGGLKLTKKEIFELAAKPDGIQQLTKRFGAGNPSVAARVLADFESNGHLAQNAKKFVGGAQYFLGYKHAGARSRPDGGNWFRDRYAVGGKVRKYPVGMGEPSIGWYERVEENLKEMAKGGLLSTNGAVADKRLNPNSSFANFALHHNKPDSHGYNQRKHGPPRDYVIVRDFSNPALDRGAPVVAGIDGKVISASGYTIVLADRNGVERMQFHHFDRISVKPGQSVSKNTVIGYQGNKPGGAVHVHLDAQPKYHEMWVAAQLGAQRTGAYTESVEGGESSPGGTSAPSMTPEQQLDSEIEKLVENLGKAFGVSPSVEPVASKIEPQKSSSRPAVTPTTMPNKKASTLTQSSEERASRKLSETDMIATTRTVLVEQPIIHNTGSNVTVTYAPASPMVLPV